MLDNLLESNNIEMQYHKRPTDLTIDNSNLDDLTAFPVHITVTSSKHEEDVDAASINVRKNGQKKNQNVELLIDYRGRN